MKTPRIPWFYQSKSFFVLLNMEGGVKKRVVFILWFVSLKVRGRGIIGFVEGERKMNNNFNHEENGLSVSTCQKKKMDLF